MYSRLFSGLRDLSSYLHQMNAYALVRHFADGKRVLDWDCGEIAGADLLSEVADRLTICAASAPCEALLRQRFRLSKTVSVIRGTPVQRKLRPDSFDLVVVLASPDGQIQAVVQRAKALLSDKGIFAIALSPQGDVEENKRALAKSFKHCRFVTVEPSSVSLLSYDDSPDLDSASRGKSIVLTIDPSRTPPMKPPARDGHLTRLAMCSDHAFNLPSAQSLSLIGVDPYKEILSVSREALSKAEQASIDLRALDKRSEQALLEASRLTGEIEAFACERTNYRSLAAEYRATTDRVTMISSEINRLRDSLDDAERRIATNVEGSQERERAYLAEVKARLEADSRATRLENELARLETALLQSAAETKQAKDSVERETAYLAEVKARLEAESRVAWLENELSRLETNLQKSTSETVRAKDAAASLLNSFEKSQDSLRLLSKSVVENIGELLREFDVVQTGFLPLSGSPVSIQDEEAAVSGCSLWMAELRKELARRRAAFEDLVSEHTHLVRTKSWVAQDSEVMRAQLNAAEARARASDTRLALTADALTLSLRDLESLRSRLSRACDEADVMRAELNAAESTARAWEARAADVSLRLFAAVSETSRVRQSEEQATAAVRDHHENLVREAEHRTLIAQARFERSAERLKATQRMLQSVPGRIAKRIGVLHYRDRARFERAYAILSDWLDRSWYLENNKDVGLSGIDPVVHYILHGEDEDRDPHKDFSTRWYLENNLDVLRSDTNAFEHFITSGRFEGRRPKPEITPQDHPDFRSPRVGPGSES